jgi:hypothetical protein
MLKRLSDLNPFRSPGGESTGSAEVISFQLLLQSVSHHTLSSLTQDEDAEYEQLKKDVVANTRRLVLEPFIIATAAAVGLNFGVAVRLLAYACARLFTGAVG